MSSLPHSIERPDLSLVMPCYNEEALVGYTIPKLFDAFSKAGHQLELVAVDNGSCDRTGERLRALAARYPGIVPVRVDVNRGYGFGVLTGLPKATAPWVGIIPADGQTDAEDVVRLFEAARVTDGRVLAKVRRRFRMDGLQRKIISVGYNLFVRMLWPRLGSIDVNGSPRLFPRHMLDAMQLKSTGWLLDPEVVIKAHYLGLRILELNVFGRMRSNGLSHVRPEACLEFARRLLVLRFSGELSSLKRDRLPEFETGTVDVRIEPAAPQAR
jgi:glycosyltransferase involved in cell wall biosynthesis